MTVKTTRVDAIVHGEHTEWEEDEALILETTDISEACGGRDSLENSIAAVLNDTIYWKQYKCISLQYSRNGSPGLFLLEAPQEHFLDFSGFQKSPTTFGSWPPFLPLQDQQSSISSHVLSVPLLPSVMSPSVWLWPSYKDPCDYIRPTWIIQDNLPTSKFSICSYLHSPLSFKVIVRGSRD